MPKKIIVLNGAARKNGHTAKLIRAFTEGARSAGHLVREFYLDGMDIHSCKGCLHAGRDAHSPCSQKDDMDQIYSCFADCDIVVFASPLYFWTITGTLKTAADRFVRGIGMPGLREVSAGKRAADVGGRLGLRSGTYLVSQL